MFALVLAAQLVSLPQALVTAKSVTVVNEGVNQDFYESVVTELDNNHRFTVVEKDADLVVAVTSTRGIGYNAAIGVVPSISYRLTIRKDQTVLYSDTFQGCCSIHSMIHKTLEKLTKRLEGK